MKYASVLRNTCDLLISHAMRAMCLLSCIDLRFDKGLPFAGHMASAKKLNCAEAVIKEDLTFLERIKGSLTAPRFVADTINH